MDGAKTKTAVSRINCETFFFSGEYFNSTFFRLDLNRKSASVITLPKFLFTLFYVVSNVGRLACFQHDGISGRRASVDSGSLSRASDTLLMTGIQSLKYTLIVFLCARAVFAEVLYFV